MAEQATDVSDQSMEAAKTVPADGAYPAVKAAALGQRAWGWEGGETLHPFWVAKA